MFTVLIGRIVEIFKAVFFHLFIGFGTLWSI